MEIDGTIQVLNIIILHLWEVTICGTGNSIAITHIALLLRVTDGEQRGLKKLRGTSYYNIMAELRQC